MSVAADAITDGDITTLSSTLGVGRDAVATAAEISEEVADGLLTDVLIVDAVEATMKVAP